MTALRFLTLTCIAVLFPIPFIGATQQAQTQPSIAFGMASVSLGMTVEQVQQRISDAGMSLKFLSAGGVVSASRQQTVNSTYETAIVYRTRDDDSDEGQVSFFKGRAIYAQYQMPFTQSPDDLAQEVAGAVDNMESKLCAVSNYSAHGTGGGFSQTIFNCGSRRFNIMTMQSLGTSRRDVQVNIEIGQLVAK